MSKVTLTHLPRHVEVVEVGPRDGLQNEAEPVSTAVKVELIDRLSAAGLPNVEAAAFVSPKWVPQMAGSSEVMAGIRRRPGTVYSALVPNMKGMEAALAAGVGEVVVFSAATEAFAQKNINCSIAESISRFRPVAEAAQAAGVKLRGSISVALGCPYQGDVAPAAAWSLRCGCMRTPRLTGRGATTTGLCSSVLPSRPSPTASITPWPCGKSISAPSTWATRP